MTLFLHLRAIYFYQILGRHKTQEYRLASPYWSQRLEGRHYDEIVLCLGYPPLSTPRLRLAHVSSAAPGGAVTAKPSPTPILAPTLLKYSQFPFNHRPPKGPQP